MTFDKVAAIVADYKGIDVADIKEDSAFTDLGLDSLDMAELAMNLAVKGMLPDTVLGRKALTRVRIYKGAEHKNIAQKPEVWSY